MLFSRSLWINIGSFWPHIVGCYLPTVSFLAQSLYKCRCRLHITAVCWKRQRFSNHAPILLIQLPLREPSLWLVPALPWIQKKLFSFFTEMFPLLLAQRDLQEMTENCDCDNVDGAMPDHSWHMKYSSGLITKNLGRSPPFHVLVCETVKSGLCVRKTESS